MELMLSGHTHGGQVALPFFAKHVNFSKLSHDYHLGIYTRGGNPNVEGNQLTTSK